MARIRTIKPKFWDDTKIGKLSRDARLLYIGLWTFSDDIGVVIGDTIWLKSKIFPYDQIQIQQFEKWIMELVRNGFICLLSYKSERFIYLPNFTRHQVINRPNVEDLNIPKDLIDNNKERITEQSLINHGTVIDVSVTIKEEEKEEEDEYLRGSNEPLCGTSPHVEEKIDYKALVNFFNEETKGVFGFVRYPISDKRKGMVNARIRQHGKQAFVDMIHKAYASDFLRGQSGNSFKATFDWLIKPTNFEKVISGNYDNRSIENIGNHAESNDKDFMRNIAEGIARANYEKQRRRVDDESVSGQ